MKNQNVDVYKNEHKMLIAEYLDVNPQLEKWQARLLANRKIGKEILIKKNLRDELAIEIKKSEFEKIAKLKILKAEIKNARNN